MTIFLIQAQTFSLTFKVLTGVLGFLALIGALVVVFLYRKKIKKEKANRDKFHVQELQIKYKVLYFWSHVIYVFLIFTFIVGALVGLSLFIGSIT